MRNRRLSTGKRGVRATSSLAPATVPSTHTAAAVPRVSLSESAWVRRPPPVRTVQGDRLGRHAIAESVGDADGREHPRRGIHRAHHRGVEDGPAGGRAGLEQRHEGYGVAGQSKRPGHQLATRQPHGADGPSGGALASPSASVRTSAGPV